MAKIDLFQVAEEIRGYVAKLKEEGSTQEEIRQAIVHSVDYTALTAYEKVASVIETSPNAGFSFTHSIYESLGGINIVMLEEGLAPVHITEPDFVREVMVRTIEEFTGESIDHVMEEMTKYKLEQEGGLQ